MKPLWRSLRLALSWFSGTYRSSERGKPRDGSKVGGEGERERGRVSTNPTIQNAQPTNHPKQACVVFPLPLVPPSPSPPSRCLFTTNTPFTPSREEGGGRGRRKPVGPPLCISSYILDKEPSSLFDERKTEDKSREQRNRTLFFSSPFQLNTHRYSAPRSVSAIRAREDRRNPIVPSIKINLCLECFVLWCIIVIQNSRLASSAICILICERTALALLPAMTSLN